MSEFLKTGRVAALYELAREIPACDAAHDFSHIERVARDAVEIYKNELKIRENREAPAVELEMTAAAALLHDCVPVAKDSPLRKESSRLASEKSREILAAHAWSSSEIDLISNAILTHSFSAGLTPQSLLGEALQDADRLEAIGAIGLYRVIATGVSMGAELFHPTDPWAEHRALDDKKYSIDHFFTKLLKLPETFRTQAAREEANGRADFLRGFLGQLRIELGN